LAAASKSLFFKGLIKDVRVADAQVSLRPWYPPRASWKCEQRGFLFTNHMPTGPWQEQTGCRMMRTHGYGPRSHVLRPWPNPFGDRLRVGQRRSEASAA